jgi:hypothetical protein
MAPLPGSKGLCSQLQFPRAWDYFLAPQDFFDTLQFPNLGEVAPLWVLLVFLDLQSISLCFVFIFLILFVLVIYFQFCLYFFLYKKTTKIKKILLLWAQSMNINDALFMYYNAAEIAKKYTDSKEGIRWEHFRRKLNSIAIELDYYNDKNCCSEQNFG